MVGWLGGWWLGGWDGWLGWVVGKELAVDLQGGGWGGRVVGWLGGEWLGELVGLGGWVVGWVCRWVVGWGVCGAGVRQSALRVRA